MPSRGRADGGSSEAPVTSKESPIAVDEEQDVEMGPLQQRGTGGGAKFPGQPRGGGRFQGRPRGFTTWRTRFGTGPEPLRVSEPSTWRRWPGMQPTAPVNDGCPRERAVESLLQSERGQGWLDEISQGLRLSDSLRGLLHRRIRFLFIQGGRVARDLGMVGMHGKSWGRPTPRSAQRPAWFQRGDRQ